MLRNRNTKDLFLPPAIMERDDSPFDEDAFLFFLFKQRSNPLPFLEEIKLQFLIFNRVSIITIRITAVN